MKSFELRQIRAATWLAIAFLTLLVGANSGCKRGSADAKDKAEDKGAAIPVEVAALTRGAIQETIPDRGWLEAEEEVRVLARTANRVTALLVEEGDVVTKGQVLVRLDDDILKSQYAKAKVRFEKAQQEHQRQKALFEQKLVSEQSFTDITHEMRQLELAFEDARRELDYTEVRAPIAGTVSRRLVKYGDLVNVNQHLFDIVDFASIVARIHVQERSLPNLALNLAARVTSTALPGQEFAGYVKRIAPTIDTKTGTVKVTIGFKDVGHLRPGMYADVQLITATRTDAILIPKRALVYDGDQMYAYRLLSDRKVERLLVEPKLADKLNIEPRHGFQEGDQLVVAGQTGLRDGMRVRLPGDPAPGSTNQTAVAKDGRAESDKKPKS